MPEGLYILLNFIYASIDASPERNIHRKRSHEKSKQRKDSSDADSGDGRRLKGVKGEKKRDKSRKGIIKNTRLRQV